MKIKQTFLSACAVSALLAGAAACTSSGGAPADKAKRTVGATPADKAERAVDATCENGTYTWFNVDKREVLTGVAEAQKLGKGGGALTNKLRPLHTPRVAVTFEKGPQVGAEAALRSLGAHIGGTDAADLDSEFADVRRPVPDLNDGSATVHGDGTFVDYGWVQQVTADFQFICGDGKQGAGRATSWLVNGSGVLECTEPIGKVKVGDPALAAARLSCGPDSPAATNKKGRG
ncbi:hypothetical protein [Streptomyces sp. NPDC127084]|uniref:hypothetical protein n=1 Tax=Streptomyces sp. NPDC127084 TaxID=3347133 RepID=UPI003657B498